MTFDPPILINVRDRVTSLRRLISWLEHAGHQRIVILDNDSRYEPLVDYLRDTPHEVRHLPNGGSRTLWDAELVPDEWFVLTDPDIVPTEDCPPDAVEHLHELLLRHQPYSKAGLGLYLDDLPESMRSLDWERCLVGIPSQQFPTPAGYALEDGVYASLVDTTFALYRPGAEFAYEALRTGAPYQARHECRSWYGGSLTSEDRFYLSRARGGELHSSWVHACERAAA